MKKLIEERKLNIKREEAIILLSEILDYLRSGNPYIEESDIEEMEDIIKRLEATETRY